MRFPNAQSLHRKERNTLWRIKDRGPISDLRWRSRKALLEERQELRGGAWTKTKIGITWGDETVSGTLQLRPDHDRLGWMQELFDQVTLVRKPMTCSMLSSSPHPDLTTHPKPVSVQDECKYTELKGREGEWLIGQMNTATRFKRLAERLGKDKLYLALTIHGYAILRKTVLRCRFVKSSLRFEVC